MPEVQVQKVSANERAVPIFDELAKRLDEVRRRAFELFEKRGCEIGDALEDWVKAERQVLGSPAAEIADKGNEYELQIALPGFEAKDVQVTATPDEIIVHAASRKGRKSTEEVLWTEFISNDLYRRLPVPNPIDAEKAAAVLEKGLLRITVPKAAEVQKKANAQKA